MTLMTAVSWSWYHAYRIALDSANASGRRYRVVADRARPGYWLVSRIPGAPGRLEWDADLGWVRP